MSLHLARALINVSLLMGVLVVVFSVLFVHEQLQSFWHELMVNKLIPKAAANIIFFIIF
jgi:hypothetical protein